MDKLRGANLVVFQPALKRRHRLHFALAKPMISVLRSNVRRQASKLVNSALCVVSAESLVFVDPIGAAQATLSSNLPSDADTCCLVIDYIRFKHPSLESQPTPRAQDEDEDEDGGDDARACVHYVLRVRAPPW